MSNKVSDKHICIHSIKRTLVNFFGYIDISAECSSEGFVDRYGKHLVPREVMIFREYPDNVGIFEVGYQHLSDEVFGCFGEILLRRVIQTEYTGCFEGKEYVAEHISPRNIIQHFLKQLERCERRVFAEKRFACHCLPDIVY